MKKTEYKAVCLLNEELVCRRTFTAEGVEEAVDAIMDWFPNMRSESARIYLNGLTVPRHKMYQNQFKTS